MIDKEALYKYIEENTYSESTLSEWIEAEDKWADFPKDSEEYRKLCILRKQREAQLDDEKKYEEYIQKERYQQALKTLSPQEFLPNNIITFAMKATKTEINSVMLADRKENFRKIINEIEKKYNINNDVELAEKSNITQGLLSKIIHNDGTSDPDYLFAISFGLRLSKEDTDKIFDHCGLSTAGYFSNKKEFVNQEKEIKRKKFIKFCYENPNKWDELYDINCTLEENKMKMLGNYSIKE